MNSSAEIAASSIGAATYAAWQRLCSARVIGVTSRGLFLLAPPQRIIFVSFERYRSPLTINLDRAFDRLRTVAVGATAQFSDTRLIFPSIDFSVSLAEDVVWQCPPPNVKARPTAEQLRTLQSIVEAVLAQRGDAGLAAVLSILPDWPTATQHSGERSASLDRWIALRHAVQTGDSSALFTGLTSLLGQGSGLTPAGDDVVIGLLLMLNRWHTDREWSTVNRSVIETAYRATTTISANLIECAADGQGDERLITVADGITAGSAPIAECVECVLGWGSSSGIDALVGMAIVT